MFKKPMQKFLKLSLYFALSYSLLFLGMGCFFDKSSGPAKPSVHLLPSVKAEYEGGAFVVIGKPGDPVDLDSLSWNLGSAEIVRHGIARNRDGLLIADTAFVQWRKLPKVSIDTLPPRKDDTTKTPVLDTVYRDTLSVWVNNVESNRQVIKLLNILPQVDSLSLSDVPQNLQREVITWASRAGESSLLKLKIRDPFNSNYTVKMNWVGGTGITRISQTDSVWEFQWLAPDSIMEDTIYLELSDARGAGVQRWPVHRFNYKEGGSVWIGGAVEVHKFSGRGQKVNSVFLDGFEVGDIAIYPTRNSVWISDLGKNMLRRFDRDGKLLRADSNLRQISSLSLDVVSQILWAGDLLTSGQGRLTGFDMTRSDSLVALSKRDTSPNGPVSALTIDQYDATRLWFTRPELDQVLSWKGGQADTLVLVHNATDTLLVNRPHVLAYDARSRALWIGDSTSLILSDTTGAVLARITGFDFIGGMAAGAGEVCVTDARQNRLYRFRSSVRGIGLRADQDGQYLGGFSNPMGVGFSPQDKSCWVADRDAGSVVQVSATNALVRRITGFKLPSVIRIHQGVD